jgi:hypothetical protein
MNALEVFFNTPIHVNAIQAIFIGFPACLILYSVVWFPLIMMGEKNWQRKENERIKKLVDDAIGTKL